MWQNNLSWKEGLFSEVPFKRFQTIKTKSQWDPPLALFTRINPNNGNDWSNLRLEGIQLPTSPAIKVFDTLFSPDYYIVAIDTRLRNTLCLVNVKSQDKSEGNISITIEYQVANPEILLTINDPISTLKERTKEAVQEVVSFYEYSSINAQKIKDNLQMLEVRGELGVSIKSFSNIQVVWNELIEKKVEKNLQTRAKKTPHEIESLKIDKLKNLGVSDPILVASILTQQDSDFETILDYARIISNAHENRLERDINLLNWLTEKDLLTRADVQKVLEELIGSINHTPVIKFPELENSFNQKLKVFLCHSSQDKQQVRDLYKRLKSETWIDTWLDEEKIKPGQQWEYEIEKAVDQTDVVVVCLSKTSISKEGYVQKEIKQSLDKAEEKPSDTIFIIPLRLEECNVPPSLKKLQWTNYFEKDGYEKLVQSLEIRANALGIDFRAIQKRVRGLVIYFDKREIWRDGYLVKGSLSPLEFSLLSYLAKNSKKVCTRDEIINSVFPKEIYSTVGNNRLNAMISRIRNILEEDTNTPKYLLTQRGVGFQLVNCEIR